MLGCAKIILDSRGEATTKPISAETFLWWLTQGTCIAFARAWVYGLSSPLTIHRSTVVLHESVLPGAHL
jgi:hypothetical protein